MRKNLTITLLFLLTGCHGPLYKTSNFQYSVPITVSEFHDPGLIFDTNGNIYNLENPGDVYDNELELPGKLSYNYDLKNGLYIFNEKNGTISYLSRAVGEHPIDIILDECIDSHESTMGLAKCYEDSANLWQGSIQSSLQKLKGSCGILEFNKIKKMHRQWLKYKSARFQTGATLQNKTQGTMWFVDANWRATQEYKHQALYLEYLVSEFRSFKEMDIQ